MASPTEESLLLDWPPLLEDTDAVGGNFPLFPVPQLASFDVDQLFQTPPEAIVPSTSDVNQQSESSVSLKVKVNDDYEQRPLPLRAVTVCAIVILYSDVV